VPVPALSKTWQFNVNQAIAAQATFKIQAQTMMLLLKNTLIGFASHPWVVAGSSNAVTAGMDGVDRWSGAGSLEWNVPGVIHSWIVLENPVTGSQLLIDLDWTNTNTEGAISARVSPSGSYAGGSITNRPTAADDIVINNNGNTGTTDGWGPSGVSAYRLHVWHSTDGECTRWTFWQNNICNGLGMLERVKNPYASGNDPESGWENPSLWLWWGRNAFGAPGAVDFGNFFVSVGYLLWHRIRGQVCRSTPGTEGGTNALLPSLLTVANEISGEWHLFPVGMWVPQEDAVFATMKNAERRGFLGEFYDLWCSQTTTIANLDTYPGDGSNQFAVLGNCLTFPWNGTAPLTA
jgi:hypothetical protein